MSERETKVIETPKEKHKVELKTYITGREIRQVEQVFYEDIDVSLVGKTADIKSVNPNLMLKSQDKMIEMLVVSVDGEKDNLLQRVLDMHSNDYHFLLNEINKVSEGSGIDKKKDS